MTAPTTRASWPTCAGHLIRRYTHMDARARNKAIEEISTLCVGLNNRRSARAVTRLYDHALAPSGLRVTQFTLLVALHRAGPIPFTKLANVLGMDRTTLTRNVAPLKRDGLLSMRTGSDRRMALVALTKEGRKRLTRAIPLWQLAQRQITEGLGARRWDAIRRDVQRITALAGESID